MSEYRNRTTGELKTKSQLINDHPNMSLPKVWNDFTFDALDVDPVLNSPKPTEGMGAYQQVIRNGVVQDSLGNWVEAWQVVDMFSDDPELGTKAEQEAEYQATLDSSAERQPCAILGKQPCFRAWWAICQYRAWLQLCGCYNHGVETG